MDHVPSGANRFFYVAMSFKLRGTEYSRVVPVGTVDRFPSISKLTGLVTSECSGAYSFIFNCIFEFSSLSDFKDFFDTDCE